MQLGALREGQGKPAPSFSRARGLAEPTCSKFCVQCGGGGVQADPNFALEVALGPPCPELVPQQPEAGLKLAGGRGRGAGATGTATAVSSMGGLVWAPRAAAQLCPVPPRTAWLPGLHTKEPRQFVFKSAHLSAEDFRIFSKEGRLL